MEPGTDRPKGAKGGAKITRESSKETLGKGRERVGMHIKKQEFTRKKIGMTTPWPSHLDHQGLLTLSCGITTLTAARPGRVKPREWVLVPTPFLLWKQPELELGKAATEPRGPETTAPPYPPGNFGAPAGDGDWEHR